MIPKEFFTPKAKNTEQEAERLRKRNSEEKAASMARHAEQKAERVRKMTPEEKAASMAKHTEERAERVRKMTPEEKAASKAKHAEQEAERFNNIAAVKKIEIIKAKEKDTKRHSIHGGYLETVNDLWFKK